MKVKNKATAIFNDKEWITINEAEDLWIEGASMLFEKMNNMSANDIINLNDNEESEQITEEFEDPLSDHEATEYFKSRGVLSSGELHVLMHNKLKEIWKNESSDGT